MIRAEKTHMRGHLVGSGRLTCCKESGAEPDVPEPCVYTLLTTDPSKLHPCLIFNHGKLGADALVHSEGCTGYQECTPHTLSLRQIQVSIRPHLICKGYTQRSSLLKQLFFSTRYFCTLPRSDLFSTRCLHTTTDTSSTFGVAVLPVVTSQPGSARKRGPGTPVAPQHAAVTSRSARAGFPLSFTSPVAVAVGRPTAPNLAVSVHGKAHGRLPIRPSAATTSCNTTCCAICHALDSTPPTQKPAAHRRHPESETKCNR